ncbi:hypothetical protein C1646_758291 [Rhizophagus diaphanus]|nr:hypothetical protein C1646_758291 [Rhizophagus diaphanus] [Rhizophagus sp. MUCL 43196]
MLKTFRIHYTDYTNIASIPSTLDDFVVMDKIVQKDGTWHYFFHIQATSFYFPNYSYCAEFRERVCASLPRHISSLITRPTEYIYQLVGISGSYLLSSDDYKRITPYSRFLDTSTSVDKNDLFISHFSVMHDPAAYASLRNKITEQTGMNKKTLCGHSSDEAPVEPDEKNAVDVGQQSVTTSSCAAIPCSTIFINELSREKFQIRNSDPDTLMFYTIINFITVLLAICKRIRPHYLRRTNMHRNADTKAKYHVSPGKVKCSLPSAWLSRKNTATRNTWKFLLTYSEFIKIFGIFF